MKSQICFEFDVKAGGGCGFAWNIYSYSNSKEQKHNCIYCLRTRNVKRVVSGIHWVSCAGWYLIWDANWKLLEDRTSFNSLVYICTSYTWKTKMNCHVGSIITIYMMVMMDPTKHFDGCITYLHLGVQYLGLTRLTWMSAFWHWIHNISWL